MKSILQLLLALLFTLPLPAQVLRQTVDIHARPETGSTVIGRLEEGKAVTTADLPGLPPGWSAIMIPGPIEGFVPNASIGKNLDVKPGASVQSRPAAGSTEITVVTADDRAEVIGIAGDWTQVRVHKDRTGYFQTSQAFAASPPPPPVATPSRPAEPSGYFVPGQAVESTGDSISTLSHRFEGRLVQTPRRFPGTTRPAHPYQLVDESGRRIAYLDFSRLLLTDMLEKYIDRRVMVYGTARRAEREPDIIIIAETLQLL